MDQDQLVQNLGNLSVMELVALTKKLEETWGVTAAPAPPLQTPALQVESVKADEQMEFTVTLTAAGPTKIQVIKIVREVTGLGLKEAKDLVEAAPKSIKEGVSKADAEAILKQLTDAGATASIA